MIRALLEFSGSYKNKLKWGSFLSFILTIFEVLNVVGIALTLDILLKRKPNTDDLVFISIFMLFGLVGRLIFSAWSNRTLSHTSFAIGSEKRNMIGEKLLKIPMGYFNEENLGSVTALVTTTVDEICSSLSHMYSDMIVGISYTAIMTIFMLFFNFQIGVVVALINLIGWLMLKHLQKSNKQVSIERQTSQKNMVAKVLESIQGIHVLKAFGLSMDKEVKDALKISRDINLKLEKILIRLLAHYKAVLKLGTVLIMGIALYQFSLGVLTSLNTIMTIVASFIMFSNMEKLGGTAAFIHIMKDNISKVNEFEKIETYIEEGENITSYDICFNNVNFSYNKEEILKNINLKIKTGETLALVGHSGSGKTTLCHLIARFWLVNKGEITIGGKNINNISNKSINDSISMVFQDVYLFNTSIMENIRFGNINATDEMVINASKKALCHDFIMNFKEGYNTVVNEGGSRLSGGEKQRIAIARAILKDAPIVILDEPTASIDPINDQLIQNSIKALMMDKTVIIVAHKLSTIKHADNIIVLESGEIKEQGRHEELMENNYKYKTFINIKESARAWQV